MRRLAALGPDKLLEEGGLALYRATRALDGSCLLAWVATNDVHGEGRKRLEREFAQHDVLDEEWAARPIELVTEQERLTLLLTDPGGEPLARRIGQPWEPAAFLRTAIGIAATLARAHRAGLIHRNLTPANILVDEASGRAWLTGFAFASRSSPAEALEPSDVVTGTLAYMAPEQTGRMGRPVDTRSDLYALGVVFYQMLTGEFPFSASDPLEWIHSHIARQPLHLNKRRPSLPTPIAEIVMKLLAKTGEERYQTAGGLEADLRHCLQALGPEGEIGMFRLDSQVLSGRLAAPERLYGRENEIALLLAAFERTAAGAATEWTLVSGPSGIGKSALVDALRKMIAPPRGIFISGKSDPMLRDTPCSTLADALRGLIRQILGGDADALASWKESVREAVGMQGSLLFELLPELIALTGPLPTLPAVGATENSLRFQSVFRRFVSAFARAESPLVIFLDDLQWVDPATLALIECLVVHPDTRYLQLIGAYRDNEVQPDGPLLATIARVRSSGRTVGQLDLGPLDVGDIGQLVGEALRVDPASACSLAELVYLKTAGNPFFARQFLASLEEEGLLRFDAQTGGWRWDEARIGAKGLSENVVELMVRRLSQLPSATQAVLKLLSCLGGRADFQTLALLAGPQETMHAHMRAAVKAGVVLLDGDRYRFLHDRVQEAAYALIAADQRAAMHWQIGSTLAREMTHDQMAERIFDIVNQLNAGREAVSQEDDRERIARLNLQAGRKARASTAYAAACGYFASGREALGRYGWDRHYELSLALCRELAECELNRAHLDEAGALIDELLARSAFKVDRARTIVLSIQLMLMRSEVHRVVGTAIEGLRMLGQEFPERPGMQQVQAEYEGLCEAMGTRTIESLVDLPRMDNPEMEAAMDIAVQLGRAAYYTDANLNQAVVCRLVKLTLLHGISKHSAYACAGLCVFLGPVFHRYADATRFGRVGVAITEKFGYPDYRAGAYNLLHQALLWTRPVSEALACLEISFGLAKDAGALFLACFSVQHRIANLLFRGDALDDVWCKSAAGRSFAEESRVPHVREVITSMQAFIQAMRGETGKEHAAVVQAALDARIQECRVPLVICSHWILRMRSLFLMGDAAATLEAAARVEPLLWSVRCHIQYVDFPVFQSLAMADVHAKVDAQRQADFRATIQANLAVLAPLAESHAPTFFHKHALVAAEWARIEGRDLDALMLYEKTIKAASDNGFVPDAALAGERAAGLCLSLGMESAARGHLCEARERYLHWGATAKVALLNEQFPEIDRPVVHARPTTIEASVEQLDLASIVKISQTLSSEIVTGRLVERLMVIAVEHAAAERGLLILQRGNEWRLEALASSSEGGVTVQRVARAATPMDLPETILMHVTQRAQSVILNDASVPNAFSHDAYIRQKSPRSVLCLPLRKQGDLVGVLYLENNLASHVFTPARQTVLDLLSSQAAISLQNAELYATLEHENAERRQSEAALRRSEERYALAIEAAADGHGEYLADDGLFYSSPRMLEQWGLSPEMAVMPRARMLELFPFHPDDREHAVGLLNKHRDSASTRLEFDARVVRRGEVRWMHCTTLYVRDAAGKLLRSSTATTDVTERKRAEEELRLSEERYALALVGSNEGIFDWDLRNGRAYLPARTQKLLGLEIGEPWRTRDEWHDALKYYPGDRQRMQAALDAHFAGGATYDHEARFIMADGEVRWFRGRGTSLRDADGTLYRFVGSLGDVTERKRAQEEMARLENRLRQAERFEAMGTLAGGIAHDFNNILGAILGFGERALLVAPEGSRLHHDLSNVVVAGERGRALVDRILSFSRGTAGERVPVGVELVVREALNLLRGKLPAHVRLRTRLQAGRAAIAGDAVQVHQLVMNLGANAAHAMTQPGTLTVSLQVTEVSQPRQARVGAVGAGTWIVLRVADQGCGMTPEILERIFDPFFTTREMGVGTGLGLSLVLRIVTQYAGAIDVESTPGEGSVFTVYLPHAGEAPEESLDDRPTAPRGQGQRVMVVDDEEALLELTGDALRELGYEPAVYGSGQAALDAFRASPDDFDVLITDLRMPGMSGDVLIREARGVRPLLPVILISGYGGDVAHSYFYGSGWADEVLTKPLRRNALATSLARVLDIA